jgi:hypothetical protein
LQNTLEKERREIADKTQFTQINGSAIAAFIHGRSYPVLWVNYAGIVAQSR